MTAADRRRERYREELYASIDRSLSYLGDHPAHTPEECRAFEAEVDRLVADFTTYDREEP